MDEGLQCWITSEVIQVAFQVPIDDLKRLDATVPDEFPSRAAALRSILDAWLTERRSLEIDRQLKRGSAEVPEAKAATSAFAGAAIEGLRAADLDKLRPVVIMHRDLAGRRLKAVLAVPLTSTIRDVPTALALGPEDGLDRRCIASLDNLTLVPVDRLAQPIGRLSAERMGGAVPSLDGGGGLLSQMRL